MTFPGSEGFGGNAGGGDGSVQQPPQSVGFDGRRTDVSLKHDGFDMFLPAEAEKRRESYRAGWEKYVEKFKAHCEEARKAKA